MQSLGHAEGTARTLYLSVCLVRQLQGQHSGRGMLCASLIWKHRCYGGSVSLASHLTRGRMLWS